MKKTGLIILALSLILSFTVPTQSEAASGWKYKNHQWYYTVSNGKYKTGWLLDKNKWYFFNSNGVMKTGWVLDKNKWYYMDQAGAMRTGWLLYKNEWYYLNKSGSMQIGWVLDKETWYYHDKNGIMQTGWQTIKDKTYYMTSSGAMVTGDIFIEGKPHSFDQSGALVSSNVTGWFRPGKETYFYDEAGQLVTGWKTIDGVEYYFKENGGLQTEWYYEDEKTYFFGEDGKQIYGWIENAGNTYFLQSDHTLATEWLSQENKWYYFNKKGIMQKGWIYHEPHWYYLAENGVMHTGWLKDNNKWFYLKNSGAMAIGELVIDGKTYHFFRNGEMNTGPIVNYTNYAISLNDVITKQMSVRPQTDKYRNNPAYVQASQLAVTAANSSKAVVSAASVNVHEGTDSKSWIYGSLKNGTEVTIKNNLTNWAEINFQGWRNAKQDDVAYYVNPKNFSPDSSEYLQFLLLSRSAGAKVSDLNNILKDKGILASLGQAFITASSQHKVNEIYLLAHALLETGNGKSKLSNGILVSSVDGAPVTPKVVYNMYGINAKDSCPEQCGSEHAYKQGWFTPEAAIIGGAQFIGERYINNAEYQQDTLYEMRWNPAWLSKDPAKNSPGHQYATDIGWAAKQVNNIGKLYNSLTSYTLYLDVPVYK